MEERSHCSPQLHRKWGEKLLFFITFFLIRFVSLSVNCGLYHPFSVPILVIIAGFSFLCNYSLFHYIYFILLPRPSFLPSACYFHPLYLFPSTPIIILLAHPSTLSINLYPSLTSFVPYLPSLSSTLSTIDGEVRFRRQLPFSANSSLSHETSAIFSLNHPSVIFSHSQPASVCRSLHLPSSACISCVFKPLYVFCVCSCIPQSAF